MAETEKLTSDERERLLGACLGSDYLDNGEFAAIRDVMAKALGIVDAQAARIEELELGQRHDEAEIRRLTSGRFAPAERAVLDACAELLLIPETGGRVRVPNQHEVELVGEAEWAKDAQLARVIKDSRALAREIEKLAPAIDRRATPEASESNDTELALDVFRKAVRARRPAPASSSLRSRQPVCQ